jgi:hypothetical protein
MKPARVLIFVLLAALGCPWQMQAQPQPRLQISGALTAGEPATLHLAGSGLAGSEKATLFLFGPGGAIKREVQRGDIPLAGDELRVAGRYLVILDGRRAAFFVHAADPGQIAFLAHPSRVPAAEANAVLGAAFLFDRYQNLVLAPLPITFRLAAESGGAAIERSVITAHGAAGVLMDAGHRSGPAHFSASAGALRADRVVEQVAADPCSLRFHAGRADDGNILVQTEPIRDCSGNAVPDGAIVTFVSLDSAGRSTVDARIKHGYAQAELPASNSATLSVAAGVVLGNQIQWKGNP